MDYEPAITERQSKFKDRSSSTTTSDHKNIIEFTSVYNFPHSTSIHSFSTTPCCTNLYTGGQDGFIRRYSLYSTLNPSSSSSPGNGNGNGNLTMKQPPIPSTTTATSTDLGLNRVPFLTGYWENEEYSPESEPATATQETTIKWGTKTSSTGSQSSVYSLAIHSQELWGLSGTSVSLEPSLWFLSSPKKKRELTKFFFLFFSLSILERFNQFVYDPSRSRSNKTCIQT